jgi:hypothetical protein
MGGRTERAESCESEIGEVGDEGNKKVLVTTWFGKDMMKKESERLLATKKLLEEATRRIFAPSVSVCTGEVRWFLIEGDGWLGRRR